MYPAVFLVYFISAAVILLASLALMVQFSLPYNRAGKAGVLCSFILVFIKVFCGRNVLLIMDVICKYVVIRFVIDVHLFFIRYQISNVVKLHVL